MDTNLFFRLAYILLIPLIPAFLLYTKLPSKTAVDGPFKGLNIKLSGAFSGYFLLVLIAISITVMTDKLNHSQSQELWTLDGQINFGSPQETKIFISGSSSVRDNIFNVNNIPSPITKDKVNMALCFYNPTIGYKILNINENFPATITTYNIEIDKTRKTIHIAKPISF